MIFNNIQIQWTRFKYFHWINSGIMDEKTTATITKKQTGILKFEKNLKQKRNFSFHSIFDIKKIEIENNAILIKKRNWNKPEQFSFRFFQFSFNIWYIFPLTQKKKNENVWCEWTSEKRDIQENFIHSKMIKLCRRWQRRRKCQIWWQFCRWTTKKMIIIFIKHRPIMDKHTGVCLWNDTIQSFHFVQRKNEIFLVMGSSSTKNCYFFFPVFIAITNKKTGKINKQTDNTQWKKFINTIRFMDDETKKKKSQTIKFDYDDDHHHPSITHHYHQFLWNYFQITLRCKTNLEFKIECDKKKISEIFSASWASWNFIFWKFLLGCVSSVLMSVFVCGGW